MTDAASARTAYVRATVVSAERPTSARPGDTAVIDAEGTIAGFVGGSCVEASVRREALRAIETGESVVLRITPDGAPQPDDPPGHVTAVNPCLSGGTLEIFLEPVLPAPLVGVFGEAPIARALVEVVRAAGYDVEAIAGADVPAGAAAVVVASHGRGEEEVLSAAVRTGVPYVGLVASRRRGAAVVAAMGDDGRHVRTPAGLDLGSRTPGEVAVSILAEIISARPQPALIAPASMPTRDAVDPVCGMTVAMVTSSLHATHNGTTSWFCGPGCRTAFVDHPERYAS